LPHGWLETSKMKALLLANLTPGFLVFVCLEANVEIVSSS
jgi:hypothetical protein